MSVNKTIPLAIFVILAFGAFADAQKVKITPVKYENIQNKVRTFGVLAPNVEELSFSISGRIEIFHADEGDRVKKGELLVVLDTEDANDALKKARSELENTTRLLNRMQILHEQRSVQTSQLEDIQAQYEQVLINFDQAELKLSRCFLKAPSSGLILKQQIDSRTSIRPGESIYIFQGDDEPWITKVDLTDRNALSMTTGTKAKVYFAPYPNKAFIGEVSKVAQVANTSDGLYRAEIIITTEGKPLRPGMIAEVDLIKSSEQKYSIVPLDALLDLKGNIGNIYLVSNDKGAAIERSVTIRSINADIVALEDDLSSFENVVIRGHHNLRDGADISIQP